MTEEHLLSQVRAMAAAGEKIVGEKSLETTVKEIFGYANAKFGTIYTKAEVNKLIGEGASRLTITVVEQLPETGKEYTLYLVRDTKGKDNDIYFEYMWIEGKWEKLGSTHLDATQVFKQTKDNLETSDTKVIQDYFTTNTHLHPNKGDLFIIHTVVGDKDYGKSSYIYSEDWEAIDGNVDASKVIFRSDIPTAGNYTQVGNITKGATEVGNIACNGKSVDDVIREIFAKELQPTITSNPAVSGFSLNGAKAVEAGTKVETATFGTAQLSAGSYTYGPATGVTAKSWRVDRVCTPETLNATGVATAPSGTDNNSEKGFVIGDGNEENTVSSLSYKATASYDAGAVAVTNFKKPSKPEVKIPAGEKYQQTSAYTSFRKYFYGGTTDVSEINSAYIRKLTNSTGAYRAQTLTITVPAGSKKVVIACLASVRGVTKVINKSAMNADITSAFVKTNVNVEGANNYRAVPYNCWAFTPDVPFAQQATLEVTLG